MVQSAFQRYGGFAAVSKIVMDFYDRILDSEKAGDFFDGVDMEMMVDHQTKFISYLLGGPASYTDEQLRRTHVKLDIDDESFDEMATILCDTLTSHGVEAADVAAIRNQITSRRHLIVTV
jgi:hemoglobin